MTSSVGFAQMEPVRYDQGKVTSTERPFRYYFNGEMGSKVKNATYCRAALDITLQPGVDAQRITELFFENAPHECGFVFWMVDGAGCESTSFSGIEKVRDVVSKMEEMFYLPAEFSKPVLEELKERE